MIPTSNTYGQVIMPQQTPIIYDPNTIYRTNGQHLPPDDNILKSLLQIVKFREFFRLKFFVFFFVES